MSAADDDAFNRLASDIARQVDSIKSNANQIKSLALSIGTERDSSDRRQQLHSLTHTTRALCQAAADQLRDGLAPMCVGLAGGARRAQKDRLLDKLAKAAGDFQEAQRLVQSREREQVGQQKRAASGVEAAFNSDAQPPPPSGAEDNSNPFTLENAQMQATADLQDDLQAAEERESQLRQLEQDIVGINEMFKDLAQMVHEQGDMVDSIEDHVGQAVMQVDEGNKNLKQAVTYQKSARRKKIIIALVVIVALAILAVIIYFAVPKPN
uniref:t-SNARE coiled-coil homology domain-containing protein n=2 Tax=Macrostomum lignano TaxID=282301 RepID=A0A1I8HYU0_9PLAT